MRASAVAAILLASVGVLGRSPALVFLAALLVAVRTLGSLWSRRGLGGLVYERRIAHDRAVWGEPIALDVAVENRKILPVPWLQADDLVTDELVVRERPVERSEQPGIGILRTRWSLGPWERATRRFTILAEHRGLFRFSGYRLTVADLFGRDTATGASDLPATLLVRPRTVPVRALDIARAPYGSARRRPGLAEDPALFAGVRPYRPGDPARRIHVRAWARTGRPVSRRYEPPAARAATIVLDIQTIEGPDWRLTWSEGLAEGLAVAAASLARRLLGEGIATGLLAAGWTGRPTTTAHVGPGSGSGQLGRITDLLGRLSPHPSGPFDRLLAGVPGMVAPGTALFVLTSRDPRPFLPALRRLAGTGYPVRLHLLGSRAVDRAPAARAAGIETLALTLAPDWRTADALVVAG